MSHLLHSLLADEWSVPKKNKKNKLLILSILQKNERKRNSDKAGESLRNLLIRVIEMEGNQISTKDLLKVYSEAQWLVLMQYMYSLLIIAISIFPIMW